MNQSSSRALVMLLRFLGTASLLALFAVVMPYAWINHIHAWLGMGALPSDPIVGYLARTLSAFYALFGGLLWTLSFDTPKNHATIRYVGFAILAFGLILLAIHWTEGMPFCWKLIEGPIAIVYGVLIWRLNGKSASD
jgi:hypothetical protein